MDRTWTVLRFTAEDTVEAVPTTWIFGSRCYWPPLTQQKLLIAIKNHEAPNTCWPSYEISIFKNATFYTYLEARQKCKRAECQSDLVSEEDNLKQRKIRNKKVIFSSSSDSEEGLLPDPPTKNKSVTSRNTEQKKKDEEKPGPSSGCSSCCDGKLLKQLARDFENFSVENMRKQNVITSIVTDLLSEIKSLKTTMTEMNIVRTSDRTQAESIFEKFKLPARTLEEFKEVENFLQDQENFTHVVQEITKIGGNSPFEFVKRAMLQFMTYKTATLFTWYGTREKLCFRDTKMSQIILKSSETIGNKKQMEEALQKFFRRAKERSLKKKDNTMPGTP